jgi:hypothetical protein
VSFLPAHAPLQSAPAINTPTAAPLLCFPPHLALSALDQSRQAAEAIRSSRRGSNAWLRTCLTAAGAAKRQWQGPQTARPRCSRRSTQASAANLIRNDRHGSEHLRWESNFLGSATKYAPKRSRGTSFRRRPASPAPRRSARSWRHPPSPALPRRRHHQRPASTQPPRIELHLPVVPRLAVALQRYDVAIRPRRRL